MINLIKAIYRNTVYRLIVEPIRSLADSIILYDIGSTVSVIVTYITENKKLKAIQKVKKGFEDHRLEVTLGSAYYESILKRLADSYNKAKEDQKKVGPPYQIGVLWQGTLDKQYMELITALRGNDTRGLQKILENFSRELMAASQGGGVDYTGIKHKPLYKYLFINTWYKYYGMYREVTGSDPVVTYPLVGNPAGLHYNGKVIPIEAIRFSYCATQMLSLLDDLRHPVIGEIGGGNGGQAYAVHSNSDRAITYIDFDIPEMLAIATYFLMAAFPEKRFLLYGEGNLDSRTFEQYDIILMPHFTLPQLENETIDLFFNQRSFSEMDGKAVMEYIHQIERIGRKYFMHINHSKIFTWDQGGNHTEHLPCTKMKPDMKLFKKIYSYPWMFNRLEEEFNYKQAGCIAFLYEKR